MHKMEKRVNISARRTAPIRIFHSGCSVVEEQLFDRKARDSDKVYRAFVRKEIICIIPSMAAEYAWFHKHIDKSLLKNACAKKIKSLTAGKRRVHPVR